MVNAAMILKTFAPWKKSYDQLTQHIKKQRHYFANKFPSSSGYGFPSGHVWMWAAAVAKSLQSCPALCDPIDGSPSGSAIPGILQARTLEWVAISFSNAWKWKVKVKLLSCVQLFATPWTAAHQALPFMGLFRQECWSGVPLPSPMDVRVGL